MTVKIGVVAHHSRSSVADALAKKVAADVIGMDVEDHPDLNERIDAVARNHLWTLSKLKAIAADSEDWCVVLEDDAAPTADFIPVVSAALRAAPSKLVGFYVGTGNPSGEVQRAVIQALNKARHQGCNWLVGEAFVSAVGYALPAFLIDDLTEYTVARREEWPMRVTRWAQHRGIDTSYSMPSLVDHDQQPSVIYPQPDALPRRAHWYSRQAPVSWNRRSVQLGYVGAVWGRPAGTEVG